MFLPETPAQVCREGTREQVRRCGRAGTSRLPPVRPFSDDGGSARRRESRIWIRRGERFPLPCQIQHTAQKAGLQVEREVLHAHAAGGGGGGVSFRDWCGKAERHGMTGAFQSVAAIYLGRLRRRWVLQATFDTCSELRRRSTAEGWRGRKIKPAGTAHGGGRGSVRAGGDGAGPDL